MRSIILLFVIVVIGCNSKSSDKTIQQKEITEGVEIKYKEPKITGESISTLTNLYILITM